MTLVLVAVLVFSGVFSVHLLVGALKTDPAAINEAGRQRMLSQRLAKDALRLHNATDPGTIRACLRLLGETATIWTRGHERLRDEIERPGALFSGETTRAALLRLEPIHREMLDAEGALVRAYDGSTGRIRDPAVAERAVERILERESSYLVEMDHLVSLFEGKASVRVGILRRTAIAFTVSSVLLLVFVAVFVLEPGVRTVQKHFLDAHRVVEDTRAAQRHLESRNQLTEELFGRYVNHDVVKRLLESPEALELGGEEREVTLLMSDLRGFSASAATLPPKKTVMMLNDFLDRMTEVILDHGGMISDFVGDCIFAIFGLPTADEDHSRRAAACALSMQLALDDVNRAWGEEGLPKLKAAIAVHTGRAIAGNIGSSRHAKYGVVGAAVNLTSRLEDSTLPGRVLVSETTLRRLGADAEVAKDTLIEAKGFEGSVRAYELIGLGGTLRLRPENGDGGLVALPRAYRIAYRRVAHNTVRAPLFWGNIIRIGPEEAEIESRRPEGCPVDVCGAAPCWLLPVASQDDVELSLTPMSERIMATTVYGRVLEVSEGERPRFRVHLTSVSPAAESILRRLGEATA